MYPRGPARPPRILVALIVGVTVVPLATLLWLGWRLLEQDRVLERQQIQQRVERSADLVVAALQRAVGASEQRLAAGSADWPDAAVAVVFRDREVRAVPRTGLSYWPVVAPLPEALAAVFAHGEDLEFRQRNIPAAIEVFRRLSASLDPAVQAGALVRFGRALRSAGRDDDAKAAYARLAGVDTVTVQGVPASLVAAYAQGSVLEQQADLSALRTLAARLDHDLRSGRWALTAPVYSLYAIDAGRWGGNHTPRVRLPEVFAETAADLWKRWTSGAFATNATSGREARTVGGERLAVVWNVTNSELRALIAAQAFIKAQWLAPVASVTREQQVSFVLIDANGARAFGTPARSGAEARRPAVETGLPWSVTTASLEPPVERAAFALRRRLLAVGLVLLGFMALTASYCIVRAVSREVAVARLQSDFVAAVSHEFRTPLTALRQFTDMLLEQPAMGENRRRQAYEAQSRATYRLTRLVESLLDFGRMEAGARRYRLEPRDLIELVRRVVDEFRSQARQSGHDVAFSANGLAVVDSDDEALARAVHNLLENAVKYSPTPHTVEVGLARHDRDVHITVRDHGLGIPADERDAIFGKFQRGEQARMLGIQGTGIGLAMVDEIVRAHHGRVSVESEPGKGSTFTIALPMSTTETRRHGDAQRRQL